METCEGKQVIFYGMEHTHIIMLAADGPAKKFSEMTTSVLMWLILVIGLIAVGATIGAIYSMKSNERIKIEEERTRQKAIEAVSEGKLSMDDAEKLLKREKKSWWEKLV